jgi:hypothetical protein
MKDAAAEPAGIAIVTFVVEVPAAAPLPAVDAELPEELLDPPALLQPVTTRATTAPAAATHHLYRFMHPSFLWRLDIAVYRSCPRTWASGCACLDRLFGYTDSACPESLFVRCFTLPEVTDGFSTKHCGKATVMWIDYYGNCIQNARPG